MRIRPRSVFAIAVGLTLVGAATSVSASSSPSATAKNSKQSASAVATHDPELSPLQPLASKIGSLGEAKYASTYAGVQIVAGTLNVYVTRQHNSRFLAAAAAADTAKLPYRINYVSRSYAVQAATSKWLASGRAELDKQGIVPEWWGSRPSHDAVLVAFQKPTKSQLLALQSTVMRMRQGSLIKRALALPQGMSVTQENYQAVAAAALNAEAPSASDIVALPSLLGTGSPSELNDYKPFKGADLIWYTLKNTNACTSNFSYNGANNPSNHWVVTAAHCSHTYTGHDFYTCYTRNSSNDCNYNVGTVKTVYYSGNDFETIKSSNVGYVFNDDSTGYEWSVNGYITAEPGDYVTTDGITSGAIYDIYVESGGGSTCAVYGGHEICHAIVLESTKDICPKGDSGGPILQRESDGYHIKAVGLIDGTEYSSSLNTHYCFGQQVYWIRDHASLRLIWGN